MKDVLRSELIACDVECDSWRESARSVGQLLVDNNLVKPAFVDSMINVVEKLGPYMILLPKICFFHGEPGENVNEACVSLITLKKPVYFDDFDNQEIKCCFAFGAKDRESHVGMLTKLAELLRNEDFVKLLTENGDKDAILKIISQLS